MDRRLSARLSNTWTGRNDTPSRSVSLPASSVSVCFHGRGAKIIIPRSPLRTCLPIVVHVLNPATRSASGFCVTISIVLCHEYLWNRACTSRYCLNSSDARTSSTALANCSRRSSIVCRKALALSLLLPFRRVGESGRLAIVNHSLVVVGHVPGCWCIAGTLSFVCTNIHHESAYVKLSWCNLRKFFGAFACALQFVSEVFAARVRSAARCTPARVSFSKVVRGTQGVKTRTNPPGRAAQIPMLYTALRTHGFLNVKVAGGPIGLCGARSA